MLDLGEARHHVDVVVDVAGHDLDVPALRAVEVDLGVPERVVAVEADDGDAGGRGAEGHGAIMVDARRVPTRLTLSGRAVSASGRGSARGRRRPG